MKYKRIVIIIFMIIWAAGIYIASNQPNLLAVPLLKKYNLIHSNFNKTQIDLLEFIIRKTMHIFEYFVLTVLLYVALKSFYIRLSIFLAPGLSLIFAVSDEWHQYYVPGRDGKLSDIFIDSIGIFLALIFIILTNLLISIKQSSK